MTNHLPCPSAPGPLVHHADGSGRLRTDPSSAGARGPLVSRNHLKTFIRPGGTERNVRVRTANERGGVAPEAR